MGAICKSPLSCCEKNRPVSVLDIGSGYNPHPQAQVLVDRYLDATSRYSDKTVVRPGQVLVQADAGALPFADKSFDVVTCFQTLEHVENPAAVCAEMVRVGRTGFITAPSEASMRYDIAHNQRPYHIWLVKQWAHATYGTHLIFIPREALPTDLPYPERATIMHWINKFSWEIRE